MHSLSILQQFSFVDVFFCFAKV